MVENDVKYCTQCGREINPNFRVCLGCGAPITTFTNEQQYNNVNNNGNSATMTGVTNKKSFSIIVILEIVFLMFYPFVSIFLGISSITTLLTQKENRDKYWRSNLIMSIIGIVIAATVMIIPLKSFTTSFGSCLLNFACLAVGVLVALWLDKFNQKYEK